MEKIYKTLKVGDVRRIGDEVRPLWIDVFTAQRANVKHEDKSTTPPNPIDTWFPCSLLGHVILPADLFNAEFRRRII